MASCWIEVNLDAIRHNYLAIQEIVGEATKIIAVVKANAYGHGAVEVARALSEQGVSYLAVTRLDEALPIRATGLITPILLLTPALPDEVDELITQRLTACLASFDDAQRLSEAATKRSTKARAHLKINTGMGRLGVEPEKAVELAKRIAALPNISVEAAFTHFAYAGERDSAETHRQFAKFQPLIHHLSRATSIRPESCHCANSAAALRFPSMRLSCIRPGTILYGQYPSTMVSEAAEQQRLVLRDDCFAAKARIIALKTLQPGQRVGYGGEWKASRPTRIATIAMGWADGMTMTPHPRQTPPAQEMKKSLRGFAKGAAAWLGQHEDAARTVTIRGEAAPIAGRIAMQQCSAEVTHIEGVQVGDEVVVSMRRTSAGAHLPRVYVGDN